MMRQYAQLTVSVINLDSDWFKRDHATRVSSLFIGHLSLVLSSQWSMMAMCKLYPRYFWIVTSQTFNQIGARFTFDS